LIFSQIKSSENDLKSDFEKSQIKSLNTLRVRPLQQTHMQLPQQYPPLQPHFQRAHQHPKPPPSTQQPPQLGTEILYKTEHVFDANIWDLYIAKLTNIKNSRGTMSKVRRQQQNHHQQKRQNVQPQHEVVLHQQTQAHQPVSALPPQIKIPVKR
jgi:hypothetical protein